MSFFSSSSQASLLSPNGEHSSSPEKSPLVIVLLGPPGVGKGTHALSLSAHFCLPHVSTGNLFRDEMRKRTPLGNTMASYINRGELVPDEIVVRILLNRLHREDCKRGYIIDGFPRAIEQVPVLEKNLPPLSSLTAVEFHASASTILERILGRILCSGCQASFHRKFFPSKKPGICDYCTSPLQTRGDDTRDLVEKRLETYEKEMQPIIEHYQNIGALQSISAEGEPKKILSEAVRLIEEYLEKEAHHSCARKKRLTTRGK
ncbi:MAG: nucleoside monophosphate kinase [Chlamydiota bacterium]